MINSSSDSQPLNRGFWYFGTSQGNFFSSVGLFLLSAFKIGTKDFLEVDWYRGGFGFGDEPLPILSSGKWVVEDEEEWVFRLLR